jgi:soluble lytic murein transglycosylase-like protein
MAKARSSLPGQLGLAVSSIAAIWFASTQVVKPVYVSHAPVVERLAAATWRDTAAARAPWAVADSGETTLATAQFEADRKAFADDLVRTGRVDGERAEKIATYAVREAYKKRVPPALIFGVLMTENATFKSSARSNVGAVGLMQVYPKVWVPTLGKFFGKNLRDDETNLRYGVHILSHYVYRAASKSGAPAASSEGVLRTGLLRYNGCVRGTNTKDCHSYPDKVMRAVERYAVAQCGAEGFEGCVEKPMRLRLDGSAKGVAAETVAGL